MTFLKKIALALLLTASALNVSATEKENLYLHIKTSSGWRVLSLNQIDKLKFAGNSMTVTDTNDKVVATFTRSDVATMIVDDASTPEAGVNDITADSGVAFSFDAASHSVIMLSDGPLDVYDLNGRHLVSIAAVAKGETVDLSAIAGEVVIIKSGSYNLKAALK